MDCFQIWNNGERTGVNPSCCSNSNSTCALKSWRGTASLHSCILASNPCMILPNAFHSPQGCTCNCHRQDSTCPWNVLCSAYTSNYRSWHCRSCSNRRYLYFQFGCFLQFWCSLSFGCCLQGGDKVATTIGRKQRVQACGASFSICCTVCLHIKVYLCTSPAAASDRDYNDVVGVAL